MVFGPQGKAGLGWETWALSWPLFPLSHGARLGSALEWGVHRDPQNFLQSLKTQGLWLFSVWILFLSPFNNVKTEVGFPLPAPPAPTSLNCQSSVHQPAILASWARKGSKMGTKWVQEWEVALVDVTAVGSSAKR